MNRWKFSDSNLASCAPACTQRCAGEGELVSGLTKHGAILAERGGAVKRIGDSKDQQVAPEQFIVSSDCGFGRKGCDRDIAFFKSTSAAQGTNIVPNTPNR